MRRGKFITIEGIEGVGKSTNIEHLKQAIEDHGHTVLTTREPGGTPMAERIRDFVAEHGSEPLPEVAELLLVFAARSLHVKNVIEPAIVAGTWVICDRFTDSSRAYQGGGRGLPLEYINTLADWVHRDLNPDLTILLDAPVETGMSRAGRRSAPDRWESEEFDFFARVREAYLQLAAQEPQRIIVVDAAQTMDAVRTRIASIARSILDDV